MHRLLLAICLLLPGMAFAADPLLIWKETFAEVAKGQSYTVNVQVFGDPIASNTTVDFYWFAPFSELRHKEGNNTWDFEITGISNKSIGGNRQFGSGTFDLAAGNHNRTAAFTININPNATFSDNVKIYVLLDEGSGYRLTSRSFELKLFNDDHQATYAIRGDRVLGWPLNLTTSSSGYDPDGFGALHNVVWQSRAYSSNDSWVEVGSGLTCSDSFVGSGVVCYVTKASDEGKEIRALVTYTDGNGITKTISTQATSEIKANIVKFVDTEYHVNEEEESVTVTLVMDAPRTTPLDVRVSATPVTATGNGVDYTGQTFTAQFPVPNIRKPIGDLNNGRLATFTIPITRDNIVTNDSEADTETVRVDIHEFGLPYDMEVGHDNLAYIRIHNYKLPIVSLDNQAKQVNESGTVGLVIRTDKTVPYDDAFTVKGKAMAKDGTTIDLSDSYWGDVGVTTLGKAPWVAQDTLFCAWIPQSSRHYTTTSTAQPSANWQSCPSGATILVKNTGTSPQEKAATPDPDPDPVLATTIESCVYSNNLSLSQVEDYAMNRTPPDNRFNRLLSALYERAVPAPLTATEANVFYQNNIGGDNESFYKAVYDTLTCVEGL